ncbi:MAG TPA: response regulator [Vicinamibacterales bacterium]|jgi:DNA-binding response OmpR family regulator|nr:response regulator [Vicinamibacterales bacterium]
MTLEVLFIGDEAATSALAPALRRNYAVAVTSTVETAREFLCRVKPGLLILDLDLADGQSASICAHAKSLAPPPTILVMTADAARVPEALTAGCDSVLMKPFLPNLFYARVGRLARERAAVTGLQRLRAVPRSQEPGAVSFALRRGTNRVWPGDECPHCHQSGVTSFEYAAHRREWFACLGCREVWVGERRE